MYMPRNACAHRRPSTFGVLDRRAGLRLHHCQAAAQPGHAGRRRNRSQRRSRKRRRRVAAADQLGGNVRRRATTPVDRSRGSPRPPAARTFHPSMRARVRRCAPAHVAIREEGPANLRGGFAEASHRGAQPGPSVRSWQRSLANASTGTPFSSHVLVQRRGPAQPRRVVRRLVAQHVVGYPQQMTGCGHHGDLASRPVAL